MKLNIPNQKAKVTCVSPARGVEETEWDFQVLNGRVTIGACQYDESELTYCVGSTPESGEATMWLGGCVTDQSRYTIVWGKFRDNKNS